MKREEKMREEERGRTTECVVVCLEATKSENESERVLCFCEVW